MPTQVVHDTAGVKIAVTRPGASTGCFAGNRVTFTAGLVAFGGRKEILMVWLHVAVEMKGAMFMYHSN